MNEKQNTEEWSDAKLTKALIKVFDMDETPSEKMRLYKSLYRISQRLNLNWSSCLRTALQNTTP